MKILFGMLTCLILTMPCSAENSLSGNGVSANFVLLRGATHPTRLGYVPNEIIIKFCETVADSIEEQPELKKPAGQLKLSTGLDELDKKYRLKKAKPLFKNFKKRRQQLKALRRMNRSLLSKKEKRILRRLNRAPKDAKVPDLSRIYKLELKLDKDQTLRDAVRAYRQDPDVEYAELNYVVSIDTTPGDPLYSIQWPLHNTGQMYPESGNYNHPPGTPDCDIDAPEAWDINTGSSQVIVAVADTGVDYNHRDMDQNMWINSGEIADNGIDDDGNGYKDDIYGYDFINDDGNPIDDHGHGTHCSGTIAAEGNNIFDITGVCWDTKIMALKFLGSDGSGATSDAVSAFYYAVDNGADVTSNSWGGSGFSETVQQVIDYAYSQGVIMLAAAGNDNNTALHYPAAYEHVISVAATNSNDQRAPFSNYGDWIDVAAPGVDVLSLRASGTSMGTTYDAYTTIASGTSMSCPHAAGVTALIISQYPGANIEDIIARLFGTTDNISGQNPGYEYLLGYGRVNAFNAVAHQPHPHIIFRECEVLDETTGNGNGFLEPGETAQLRITLKNIWVDAINVAAQLGSNDPCITILDDLSDYGDIARGEEQDNSGDLFEIALSEEYPGRRVVCYLTITADGGYTNIVYFPTSAGFRVPEQFSAIQEAVDVSQDGDAITVADGTYTGDGNRDIDFNGKAITIQSENGPEHCIIDCNGSAAEPHRGFYLHSGEGPDSVIDGFTIINGYAPLNSEHFKFRAGGAISSDGHAEYPWSAYTSPTIKNCIIRGNRAADMGGGIFLHYGNAEIINCDVSNNYNGGIFIYGWPISPRVTHCNLSNNVGIGIECGTGWICYGPTISNCLISDNTAGGIFDDGHNLCISNCTIANNKGYAILGRIDDLQEITMANSIVWGNTLGAFNVSWGTYDVTYSDIQTGQSGQGNINTDPNFVFSDDYHLMVGSPCIDAGTNNPFDGLDGDDLDGNPRLQDGDGDGQSVVDMGAYEFAEWVPGVPYIYVTPRELIYNCSDESPTQEDQTIYISNAGAGTLNWEVIEDCNWVEVIPTSGQSAGEVDEITVRVDTTGQPAGHYSCTLQIVDELAAVSVQLVRVNLSVGPRRVPQQYSTIQAAIDAALEGNTVMISDGLYTGPGNRDINFWGKAVTMKNANGPENCVIDCEKLGKGFLFKNKEGRNSILEGLTIINASPNVGSGLDTDEVGVFSWATDFFSHSGIYCQYSSPTINNCRVLDCWSADSFGGGIYCKEGSPKITNCLIEGNSSEIEGGGIFLHYDTPAVVENCTITNNSSRDGGGISVWTAGTIFNNCLIAGNSASNFGGGAFVKSSNNFRNCTIADNTAVSGGAFYIERDTSVIKNSILWGNWPDEVYLESGTATIRYSDVEGGWSGTGNINQNPNFAFGGDYHLIPGSPSIDAGNNSAVPVDIVTDLDGSERFYDDPNTTDTGTGTPPIVDMGAYEYSQTPRIAVSPLEFEFLAEEGGSNPDSQILSVRNCGGEVLKWEISENCSWLNTDPNSGSSTGESDEVILSPDISGLAVGRYDCELTVWDPNAVNSPRTVTVALYILGGVSYVPSQFFTIQDAIDRVPPGNTIIVADGGYAGPGNRNIDFNGKAITLRSANGPDNCFICAWGESHRGFHFHSGEGADSVLEGFTIFGGSNEKGAGICCENSSPSIINCKVNVNKTFAEPTPENAKGGGIYCQNSYALISDCTLLENYSEGKGGGLCNLGGGPMLTNCIIDFNLAPNFGAEGGGGGGIYNLGGDLTLVNCTISNNISDFGDGGGIYNSGGTVTLTNCTIHGNSICVGNGDAIYNSSGDLTAKSCLIWGNFDFCDIGDAIYNSGSATLTNCTIADNSENGIYSDGGTLTLQNCIVWGHQNEIVGSASVTYSDVRGGYLGEHNIDANPLFGDVGAGDYHLSTNSPCINAGDPGYNPDPCEVDIDGDPRVLGFRLDIGADESYFFSDDPVIDIWPTEFEFVADQGGPNPQAQILDVCTKGGTLNWQVFETCSWLDVAPDSGSSEGQIQEVTLSVDVSGLPGGNYNCQATIYDANAVNNPQTVDVNLVVRSPMIEASPLSFEISAFEGGENPESRALFVRNSGFGTLHWEIACDCDWLQVSQGTGSSTGESDQVTLSIDIAGLAWGDYDCELTISDPNAGNSPQMVQVILHIIIGDFDGDMCVGVPDLTVIAAHWLEADCNDCSGADLNNDGGVDGADFAVLTHSWLWCLYPSPVAHWELDYNAIDSSGNGHDGTLVGGATFVVDPDRAQVLSLNGTDSYVEIPGYKGITSTYPRTCTAWIKKTSTTWGDVLSWGENTDGKRWHLWVDSAGHLRLAVKGGYVVANGTNLNDDNWHHVVAVFEDDGTPNVEDVKLYVDGEEDTFLYSAQVMNTGSVQNVKIGLLTTDNAKYFDGQIDDVRIYDKALIAEEIADLAGAQ